MAKIIRPRIVRARPGQDGPVPVEWDEGRGMYVAACPRCTDTLLSERIDQAHEWADEHRCDSDLIALLTEVLDGWAA
jgi:hypothetical protein